MAQAARSLFSGFTGSGPNTGIPRQGPLPELPTTRRAALRNCSGLHFPEFIPGPITGILAAIQSESGFTDSVSARYMSTLSLPEPITFSMMGVGLSGLGLYARYRAKT